MKKFISLFIAAILVCTCFVTAFATTYDASKVNVVTAPQVGDKVDDINADLTIQSFFFNGTEDQKAVVGRIFEGAEKEYIKWTKSGASTPMESTATFTAGEYTVEVYYNLPSTLNYVESTVYSINGTTVTPNIADGMLKVSGKVTVSATEYTVTFDTAGLKTIEAIKLAKDAAITLPDATVTGYKFNGWFADKEFKTKFEDTKMPAEDITIYASYTKLYKLSFDTQDLKKIDAVWFEEGAVITLPNTDVDNYKFNGWFTDKEYKTNFVATKMPAEDITIYASYTKLYKLSFDTQDLKKIDAMWLEEGATIVLPTADVENYKFMGWYTDAKYEKAIEKDAKMPKADTVLYGCYAVKLSKLSNILKDVDMEQFVKDSKLSPETFNKLAKTLGFEVKYSVNGKTYTVNDIVNFTDELTAQLKKDIKSGDIADVDITISLGKDDSESMAIYVYNDIGVKEDDEPKTSVTDPTKSNTEGKKSSGEKNIDIPDTGAESIAPAVITFLTSMATVGGAVVLKKKKEN